MNSAKGTMICDTFYKMGIKVKENYEKCQRESL